MKNAICLMSAIIIISLNITAVSFGDQTVIAKRITEEAVIDGIADEPFWRSIKPVVTHDDIADIDITLKSAYTDKKIFFLVTFPDTDESRRHKGWVWNDDKKMYETGTFKEDTFVFKWNMETHPVDLSVYADNPYSADIWFWKADRTDPVGFADDKIQILSVEGTYKHREMTSRNGSTMYLQRRGDAGSAAYEETLYADIKEDIMPRFKNRAPSGSRADIMANGIWHDGRWTIEFGRALNTGNDDDVQFVKGGSYQFGVSRYEIAGREPEYDTAQPLYGCGDTGETLILQFEESL